MHFRLYHKDQYIFGSPNLHSIIMFYKDLDLEFMTDDYTVECSESIYEIRLRDLVILTTYWTKIPKNT